MPPFQNLGVFPYATVRLGMGEGVEVAWIDGPIARLQGSMDKIAQADQCPDAAVVRLRDEAKELLTNSGLMHEKRNHCSVMGVHPSNRYGDGCVPADVLSLISKIFSAGFSKAELKDPASCEMLHFGHPRHQKYLNFNGEVVDNSCGVLPTFTSMIEAVTITCGHTTQGLRCFVLGCTS